MVEKKPTAKVKANVIKNAAPAEKAAAAKKAEEKVTKTMAETEAKKTTARKTAAKKPAAKKAPAKKAAELKSEVTLQFNGQDYTTERLIQSAKDVWQYDMGRDVADMKDLQIFVKPDDHKAYGLVNGTEQLSFDI